MSDSTGKKIYLDKYPETDEERAEELLELADDSIRLPTGPLKTINLVLGDNKLNENEINWITWYLSSKHSRGIEETKGESVKPVTTAAQTKIIDDSPVFPDPIIVHATTPSVPDAESEQKREHEKWIDIRTKLQKVAFSKDWEEFTKREKFFRLRLKIAKPNTADYRLYKKLTDYINDCRSGLEQSDPDRFRKLYS